MSQYFDRDFFRFFLGFIAILAASLVILLATRIYQESSTAKSNSNTSSVIKTIKN